MDEPRSNIQSFYKDKTIFITGASGFMGKVLVEKLLYSCSDLNKIYVLMRAKRDRSFDDRLKDIFKLPLFQRIRTEKSEVLNKVIPFNGDVCSDNLGLTDEQYEHLINEVNVVFHCAANLRMEAKLKDAVEMNLIFLHLSTAFCYVEEKELDERIYDSPNPHDIMSLVQWLDEDSIDLITPKLLHPHPNTYTYTKRLAETLVANEYPNLPCCIARPSIVLPSYKEPIPGWVDNLNGPVGILVGGGKGIIRSMHCIGNYNAEVIPVDIAINTLIAIAYKIAASQENSENIPVINITQSDINRITFREILKKGKEIIYEYPFEGQIWYPTGNIHSNKFVHNIFVFFFQIIPAYLIDFLMLLFQQKRFMVRIQNRILTGLAVLQYFSTRQWKFCNKNLIALHNGMSSTDKEIFPIVIYNADIISRSYFKHVILGVRQYCLKEDLSTLPKARRHQKIIFVIFLIVFYEKHICFRLYVIHITTIYLLYFGVLYFIYNILFI
ncbi:hypothetical protein ACFW04_009228 [Cataglyphis niger]